MRREQLTEKILDIKRKQGWSWRHITDEIGGVSPYAAAAVHPRGVTPAPRATAEGLLSQIGMGHRSGVTQSVAASS